MRLIFAIGLIAKSLPGLGDNADGVETFPNCYLKGFRLCKRGCDFLIAQ
jgi:hypothetical protein